MDPWRVTTLESHCLSWNLIKLESDGSNNSCDYSGERGGEASKARCFLLDLYCGLPAGGCCCRLRQSSCLFHFGPVAEINTMMKSNLGKERFIWLMRPDHSLSLRMVEGRNSSRSRGWDHGGRLLAVLFSGSQTTCPTVACTYSGLSLLTSIINQEVLSSQVSPYTQRHTHRDTHRHKGVSSRGF